ncbi:MAG: IPT/TIG domain-containing protein [Adhaeribacter sp.]
MNTPLFQFFQTCPCPPAAAFFPSRLWWGPLLWLLLSFFPAADAGAQTKAWDKTLGGAEREALTSLQQTSDGGAILGGASFSGISGDKTQDNQGPCLPNLCTNDYWVVKLDAQGNKSWDKTLGGSGADFLVSVKQTRDGGYLLGGYSSSDSSGHKSQNSRNSYDFWIVKLDSAGNKVWDKTYGSDNNEVLAALQQTSDGGYILGGSSPPGRSGDKTGPSQGNYDFWILKLDSAGNKVWDKTIGGSKSDFLADLQQTPDGGYILGGFSDSNISGDKTSAKRGGNDFWIVKLDAAGQHQWDKTYGGSKTDILRALQHTPDGGYAVAGYVGSGSDGDISGANQGSNDFWVLKLDSAGNKTWDKTYGGKNEDLLSDLQLSEEGGYLLGGFSASGSGGDKTQDSKGGYDFWVLKLDSAGSKVWDQAFGGNKTDALAGFVQTSPGHYLLAGTSDSDPGGDKSQAPQGITDFWVLQLTEDSIPPQALISSIVPEKDVPGAIITISGQNLATTSALRFNGLNAAFQVIDDNTLLATVPVEATSGKITLVTGAGTVTSVSTFNVRHPGILSFAPAQGRAGTRIYISGDRLTTTSKVYFGQVLAPDFEVLSDSTMTAVVPDSAGTGRIKVVLAGGGYGNSKTKFVVLPDQPQDSLTLSRRASPGAMAGAATLAAWPNPFRQQVTFSFSLPQTQPVKVAVYDILGREVSLLYEGEMPAHQAARVEWRPDSRQAGGMYFLRLLAPGQQQQHKVLLLK